MGDSIFKFADKFGYESPFGDWLNPADIFQSTAGSLSYYWSSDEAGSKKIIAARLYDTVYFQIKTSGLKASSSVQFHLYELDSFGDTKVGYNTSVSIPKSGKASIKLELKKEWEKYLDDDSGGSMELFWKAQLNGEYFSLDTVLLNVFEDPTFTDIFDNNYRYSCNCGWIDKKHAFKPTDRTEKGIGAKSLWNQLKLEDGLKSSWKNGFQVIYTQDAAFGPFTPGVTKKYFVKYGLSIKTKEEIALTILQEVSMEFEAFQALGTLLGRGASSFEPADLVSNLLSLYKTVRPKLTESVLLKKCNELDLAKSVEVYKKYAAKAPIYSYKNKKFTPLYFMNDHCTNSEFPTELQEIKPRKKDDDTFRDWIDLFDIYEGKPPLTGPKD